MEAMGTGWRELRVGPFQAMTQTVSGLAGEVGCVRGQALPCMEGATGLSRRIFPKKKKTLWGTLGNSPAATSPVSSPPHHPLGDCAHLILEGAESTGTTRREGSQLPGVCLPTGEGLHLISEGTETTRTRESANQGRLCMHTHSLEKAYHKKKKKMRRSWEHQDSS